MKEESRRRESPDKPDKRAMRKDERNTAKAGAQRSSGSAAADNAVTAYRSESTPLGSYSGITNAMSLPGRNFFPETKRADLPEPSEGKMYIPEDELPVQDADDL